MEIKMGEIVRLNSGSPDLKVIGIDGGSCELIWESEGEPRRSVFPLACVTPLAVLQCSALVAEAGQSCRSETPA